VSAELEVAFDLHYVLVARWVFLHYFQDLDLQLKLLVEFIALLQYL